MTKPSPWYVLDADGKPVQADLGRWATFGVHAKRHLGYDTIGDVLISTVFIGVHPVLWETMIFGGQLDQTQERYSSREAALAGHRRWLATVRDTQSGGSPCCS